MTYEQEFGLRLKEALKLAGMTYAQFGKRVGYIDRTIYCWANGRSLPQLPVLAVAADVLNVDAGWLVTGKGTPR